MKHEKDGSVILRREMESILSDKSLRPRLTKKDAKTVTVSITYFRNQKSRIEYWRYRESGFPIGSGVTEATYQALIKSRFCGSGAS